MHNVQIEIVDNRHQPDEPGEAAALNELVIAGQGSLLSNLAFANMVSSNDLSAKGALAQQNASSRLRLSILSSAVNQVQNPSPLQARSAVDILSNNGLAQDIADLKSIVATFATTRDSAISE